MKLYKLEGKVPVPCKESEVMSGGVKRYPVIGHFYQNGDASICSEGDYQNQFPVPPDDKFEVVLASDHDAALSEKDREIERLKEYHESFQAYIDIRETVEALKFEIKDYEVTINTLRLELERAKAVNGKLREQRNYYFRYANTEFLKSQKECDAEIAELEKVKP